HERGAFTGAQTQRRGRFEQAEGGTLFLDEIGDMPFDLQTRLLRVLSDGHFYRVGGHQAVKAHVRVIAATHQDLEQRVRNGGFREDLFHRLNVIRLRLPALRERNEDVPMLARHFLQQSARQLGVEPKRMGVDAMQRLQTFAFPGNVRQLENICHWLTVMAPAQVISVKDLPPEVLGEAAPPVGGGNGGVPAPAALPHAPAPLAEEGLGRLAVPVSALAPPHDTALAASDLDWVHLLGQQARQLLEHTHAQGHGEVWDQLSRRFEAQLIRSALAVTHGRRVEAAQRLGIGRNTITRKLQELGMDEDAFE
ncbi:MAG TPA: nitrogen regulation protein NR(I), partial [Delftia acidovorans]|nr:nitrogen regulation protein NR(I) [Delftia acidovorans]